MARKNPGIRTGGLDSCRIILPRRKKLIFLRPRRDRRKPNEASDQDFDPDVWISGHILGSRRSAGSRPGRRADSCMPTPTTTAR